MNIVDRISWIIGKEAGSIFDQEKKETDMVLYRCKECGYWSKSIGYLHGHMEGHTKWYSLADVDKFMEMTEKIVVDSYRTEDIDSLEGENP